jgi:hypothetical protein
VRAGAACGKLRLHRLVAQIDQGSLGCQHVVLRARPEAPPLAIVDCSSASAICPAIARSTRCA